MERVLALQGTIASLTHLATGTRRRDQQLGATVPAAAAAAVAAAASVAVEGAVAVVHGVTRRSFLAVAAACGRICWRLSQDYEVSRTATHSCQGMASIEPMPHTRAAEPPKAPVSPLECREAGAATAYSGGFAAF